MKFLDKLSKNENRFQRIIGLNFKQLDLLVKRITPLWNKAEKERLDRETRKRGLGGGHPYKLETLRKKIIAVLIYYKQYPTQEFLGIMFQMDQSNVSRLLSKILPLIEQAADPELKTYLAQALEDCKKERISNWNQFLTRHPDLKDVSTDATEQQCFRATDHEQQKKYYSGKTKQHAIKTQISVAATGRILDVSKSYPGSIHDKTIIDQEKTIEKFDKRIPRRFDSGYQGIAGDNPDHYLILPVKKPKGKELTKLDKEFNKSNSKRRIVAEHALARLKKFRICASVFRQPLQIYNQTFRNMASILNFKLQNPQLAI
jgi:hypothetical protein